MPASNARPKRGADLQWIIGSTSLAISLGIWSLFASQSSAQAESSAAADNTPTDTVEVITESSAPAASPQLLMPGQTLILGTPGAPTPTPVPQTITRTTRTKRGGGGGTTTGSSRKP